MKPLITDHPLIAFFTLAFLGSWIVWSPWWLLSSSGLGLAGFELPLLAVQVINLLGLFAGPFLAAVLVTKITEGSAKSLLNRIFKLRAPRPAYLVALVVIPLVIAAGALLWPSGVALENRVFGVELVITLLITFVIYFLGGPIPEEPGWRGFALPRMQAIMHPVAAALLLGVIWGLWHAPLALTAEWDTPTNSVADVLAFLFFAIGLSVLLSWASNLSDGSIWLPILAHNMVNWTLFALPMITGIAIPELWPVVYVVITAAAVVIAVTRGRLGLPERQPRSSAATAPHGVQPTKLLPTRTR